MCVHSPVEFAIKVEKIKIDNMVFFFFFIRILWVFQWCILSNFIWWTIMMWSKIYRTVFNKKWSKFKAIQKLLVKNSADVFKSKTFDTEIDQHIINSIFGRCWSKSTIGWWYWGVQYGLHSILDSVQTSKPIVVQLWLKALFLGLRYLNSLLA